MRCGNCGTETDEPRRFCPRCGQDLAGPTGATTADPGSRRHRARTVALYVGAFVVLGALGVAAWHFAPRSDDGPDATPAVTTPDGSAPDGSSAPTGSTPTSYSLAGRDYRVGDCVTWDRKPGSGERLTRVVECDQPHIFQVSGRVSMMGRFAQFPSNEEWGQVFAVDCVPSIEALLGRKLDPSGSFYPYGVFPTRVSWGAGERTVWCGVASGVRPNTEGDPTPFTGDARGADQTNVRPIGACITTDGRVVDCTAPHTWEITGYADLTGRAETVPAVDDDDGWDRLVGDECDRLARAYRGRSLRSDETYSWSQFTVASWDAGRRTVECLIGRPDGNRGWIEVTGSLRGG